MMSIQTQIMVAKPFFNEPGQEEAQGTASGEEGSREYNQKLRLECMRHAMVTPIRHPPAGFEVCVRRHFLIQRRRLFAQCQRWVCESTPDARPRFERALVDLRASFAKLLGEEQEAAAREGREEQGAEEESIFLAALAVKSTGGGSGGDGGNEAMPGPMADAAPSTAPAPYDTEDMYHEDMYHEEQIDAQNDMLLMAALAQSMGVSTPASPTASSDPWASPSFDASAPNDGGGGGGADDDDKDDLYS
jgi:hypothetical protein